MFVTRKAIEVLVMWQTSAVTNICFCFFYLNIKQLDALNFIMIVFFIPLHVSSTLEICRGMK